MVYKGDLEGEYEVEVVDASDTELKFIDQHWWFNKTLEITLRANEKEEFVFDRETWGYYRLKKNGDAFNGVWIRDKGTNRLRGSCTLTV